MHRQLHRRRPFAAAPSSLFTAAVAPACGTLPALGPVYPVAVPPVGTRITISGRLAGGMPLRRTARNLSTGDPGQAAQMRMHFPNSACHTGTFADTFAGNDHYNLPAAASPASASRTPGVAQ